MMVISEPQLVFDLNEIGKRDTFTTSRHECLDGFLKQKEECLMILPAIFKVQLSNLVGGQNTLLNK